MSSTKQFVWMAFAFGISEGFLLTTFLSSLLSERWGFAAFAGLAVYATFRIAHYLISGLEP